MNNYFVLPRGNNTPCLSARSDASFNNPYISFSLFHYHEHYIKHVSTNMMALINPYAGKFKSPFCYEFFETCILLNIFNKYKRPIKLLNIVSNAPDIICCYDILRENYNDTIVFCESTFESERHDFHFILFDAFSLDYTSYISLMIKALFTIFNNQLSGGTCIIRINTLFNKPILDVVYALTCMYSDVAIYKPEISNIASFEKYIICTNYCADIPPFTFIPNDILHITTLCDGDLPYYFKTRLNEINMILGCQQLEFMNLAIDLTADHLALLKIESLKKIGSRKFALWCEKYKPFPKSF